MGLKTPDSTIARMFELKAKYGLTNEVIAKRLGMGLRTVRQHLNDPRNREKYHLSPSSNREATL